MTFFHFNVPPSQSKRWDKDSMYRDLMNNARARIARLNLFGFRVIVRKLSNKYGN